jgi:glucuronosyltransferase
VSFKEKTLSNLLFSCSFNENAKILSTAYKNRPVDPLDLAVRWVEYVLETKGAKLMQSHSVKMNFFTYYSLDVIGVLLAICYFLYKLAFGLLSYNKNTERKHPRSGNAKIKEN